MQLTEDPFSLTAAGDAWGLSNLYGDRRALPPGTPPGPCPEATARRGRGLGCSVGEVRGRGWVARRGESQRVGAPGCSVGRRDGVGGEGRAGWV